MGVWGTCPLLLIDGAAVSDSVADNTNRGLLVLRESTVFMPCGIHRSEGGPLPSNGREPGLSRSGTKRCGIAGGVSGFLL